MPVGLIHRDALSAPFFDGTARGELLLPCCARCAHRMEPVATHCSHCGSRELEWAPATGTGTIVTWTVVHTRANGSTLRTAVAIVELVEGPWLEAQIVAVDPDDITSGMPVRVGFERADGGEALPVFRPAGQTDA